MTLLPNNCQQQTFEQLDLHYSRRVKTIPSQGGLRCLD